MMMALLCLQAKMWTAISVLRLREVMRLWWLLPSSDPIVAQAAV